MCLNECWVLLETVVQLPQCSIGVIGKPFGLGKDQLCVCKTAVLFCNVFKQFDCLDEVLRRGLV